MGTVLNMSNKKSLMRPVTVLGLLFAFVFIIITLSSRATSGKGFTSPLLEEEKEPERPIETTTTVQFSCGNCLSSLDNQTRFSIPTTEQDWTWDPERDSLDYGLTFEQCEAAFPGLFRDLDASVQSRKSNHVTPQELERNGERLDATVRAMIYNGQLYVIYAQETTKDIYGTRDLAVLHDLNRAIVASRESRDLPNIEFVMSVDDYIISGDETMWSYDRKADDKKTWLMPDFGFWSWPEPGVGSYHETRAKMREVEENLPFTSKIAKLVWRGAIWTEPVIRQALYDQAEGHQWSDVKDLNWADQKELEQNRLNIEDHCKYQFVAHTEGRSFSARLKYIINCHSVVVAHQLKWIQPFEYLMIPDGPDQNFVQVNRNFTDLAEKMEYYTANPSEAERIAQNSNKVFRDRYLTPAASACYWRRLWRGWSEVSFRPEFYETVDGVRKWRGVPFESYALMRSTHWDPH